MPRAATLFKENSRSEPGSSLQFVDGCAIHVHAYRAIDFDGTPTETQEAIPVWVDGDRASYDEMWVDGRIWLPLLIAGTHFDARFIFDGDARE
jgi:8-oxo-dGTP diphosphatase